MVPSNINLAWTSWTRHSNLETKLQHVKFLSWIVAIQSADLLEKLQLFLCCMPNSKFAACKTAKAQMQECVFKCLPCPNEIIPYNHFAHLVATSFRIMFAWCIPRRKNWLLTCRNQQLSNRYLPESCNKCHAITWNLGKSWHGSWDVSIPISGVNMLWMIQIFPTDFRIVSLICSWVTLLSVTPGFLPSQELYLNLPWRRSARLWSTYYSCHKSTNYLICFVVILPKTLAYIRVVWMILVPCSQYFFISIEGLGRRQYDAICFVGIVDQCD